MKKIILGLFTFLVVTGSVFAATTTDARNFFNRYVEGANSYNPVITTMYAPDAKIIRQVVKPDGTIVTRQTNTARYISEMRKGQVVAKVRHYKNYYTNVRVIQTGTDTYKISSLRQPSGESYKLKAYMVVRKQPSGKWLITEEMMQTKVQSFLRHKNKG